MNASNSEVVAPASTELTTPAKITPKPTSAITAAASHTFCETSVPMQTNAHPAIANSGLAGQPHAHRPAEVDQQQHRERAERRKCRQHRVADELLADREHRWHHDRGAARTAQRGKVAVALGKPPQRVGGLECAHAAAGAAAVVASCARPRAAVTAALSVSMS